ncbi:hypothetical protein J1605_015167 [Eschrichtius robustus]|uniref:Uncharacterized protein n=1 Tax=Eschrichtius robustus TaxID=9764 RepID=A0AB34GAZ6_ESCRO|nr:hypothetical protein J1605_015167 [Eschrichtius robustus]
MTQLEPVSSGTFPKHLRANTDLFIPTLIRAKAAEPDPLSTARKIKPWSRASLVAQWLRIRLPMQGTRVQALVREDPTCCGATEPMCHNY